MDTTIIITKDARGTIDRMWSRVQSLAHAFGPNSPEHLNAARSFGNALTSLFDWSNLTVSKDGELSLVCISGKFCFGLIYHATQRTCQSPGCHAVINDDNTVWAYSTDAYVCLDGRHIPSYPLGFPVPGTWSFHS